MEEACTVYRTIDIIGKKWSLLIILSIYKSNESKKQYSRIKDDLHSITPKILSTRLKELEKEGLIKKDIDNSNIPVKTFYSLTESGKELMKIIQEIKKWGLKWKFDNPECKITLCRFCRL